MSVRTFAGSRQLSPVVLAEQLLYRDAADPDPDEPMELSTRPLLSQSQLPAPNDAPDAFFLPVTRTGALPTSIFPSAFSPVAPAAASSSPVAVAGSAAVSGHGRRGSTRGASNHTAALAAGVAAASAHHVGSGSAGSMGPLWMMPTSSSPAPASSWRSGSPGASPIMMSAALHGGRGMSRAPSTSDIDGSGSHGPHSDM